MSICVRGCITHVHLRVEAIVFVHLLEDFEHFYSNLKNVLCNSNESLHKDIINIIILNIVVNIPRQLLLTMTYMNRFILY